MEYLWGKKSFTLLGNKSMAPFFMEQVGPSIANSYSILSSFEDNAKQIDLIVEKINSAIFSKSIIQMTLLSFTTIS
jgi:hypothetical protein